VRRRIAIRFISALALILAGIAMVALTATVLVTHFTPRSSVAGLGLFGAIVFVWAVLVSRGQLLRMKKMELYLSMVAKVRKVDARPAIAAYTAQFSALFFLRVTFLLLLLMVFFNPVYDGESNWLRPTFQSGLGVIITFAVISPCYLLSKIFMRGALATYPENWAVGELGGLAIPTSVHIPWLNTDPPSARPRDPLKQRKTLAKAVHATEVCADRIDNVLPAGVTSSLANILRAGCKVLRKFSASTESLSPNIPGSVSITAILIIAIVMGVATPKTYQLAENEWKDNIDVPLDAARRPRGVQAMRRSMVRAGSLVETIARTAVVVIQAAFFVAVIALLLAGRFEVFDVLKKMLT
jgi:hypothetical protein